MKHLCFMLLILIITTSDKIFAQDSLKTTSRAKNIYIEGLGSSFTFSINYDTRFSNTRNGFGGRIGVGFLPSKGNTILIFPAGINYILGKRSDFFETGIGVFVAAGEAEARQNPYNTTKEIRTNLGGSLTIGYRYQPLHGGINFRANGNLLILGQYVFPWPGVSIGYTFKK